MNALEEMSSRKLKKHGRAIIAILILPICIVAIVVAIKVNIPEVNYVEAGKDMNVALACYKKQAEKYLIGVSNIERIGY